MKRSCELFVEARGRSYIERGSKKTSYWSSKQAGACTSISVMAIDERESRSRVIVGEIELNLCDIGKPTAQVSLSRSHWTGPILGLLATRIYMQIDVAFSKPHTAAHIVNQQTSTAFGLLDATVQPCSRITHFGTSICRWFVPELSRRRPPCFCIGRG
jgi:hypothetical protein